MDIMLLWNIFVLRQFYALRYQVSSTRLLASEFWISLYLGNDQQYNGTTYLDKEDKSYQWFGATVVSSGVNGLALVSIF